MISIASSIDGRLRVRVPELRGALALAECRAELAAIPGVALVVSNERTGSLLIHYDTAQILRSEMEARACVCLGMTPEVLDDDGQSDLQDAPRPAWTGALKWRPARRDVNRYAKLGAVACMAVSLLAIAARQKRLHAWSGAASLVLVAVHMAIHRRTLLR